MGKKKLLIIALPILGVLSFGVSLVLSVFFGAGEPKPPPVAAPEVEVTAGLSRLSEAMVLGDVEKLRPREEELEGLIKQLRGELEDIKRKTRRLDEREKRMRLAEEALKKDASDLEKLRVELVTPLKRLQEELAKLQMTRVLIANNERKNLKKAATFYAGMKDREAAKILEGMQPEEAAKMLYYIGDTDESLAGKILTKMDPRAAVKLTDMLKRIQEQNE